MTRPQRHITTTHYQQVAKPPHCQELVTIKESKRPRSNVATASKHVPSANSSSTSILEQFAELVCVASTVSTFGPYSSSAHKAPSKPKHGSPLEMLADVCVAELSAQVGGTPSSAARPPLAPIQPPHGVRRSSRLAGGTAKKTIKAMAAVASAIPPPAKAERMKNSKRKREPKRLSEDEKEQQQPPVVETKVVPKIKGRSTVGRKVRR